MTQDQLHDQRQGEHRPPAPFKLTIDQKPYTWPEHIITGLQIKQLAGITQADYGVWRIVPGPKDDERIEDNERAELDREHAEHNRFITGPVKTTEG